MELILNGSFVTLYFVKELSKIPKNWNIEIIDIILESSAMLAPIILLLPLVVNYTNSRNFEVF